MQPKTALSVFTGAGGLDLGAEASGFSTVVAVDYDADSLQTLRLNRSAFPALRETICADLAPMAASADAGGGGADEVVAAGGFSDTHPPDLLIGGPPCTPFSKSGFWLEAKRSGADPAASLLQSYTAMLRAAQPRFFILENVNALSFDNQASRPALDRLRHEIVAAGYRFWAQVLNCADYGVPQARRRLFVVGARRGEQLPAVPVPTHAAAPSQEPVAGTQQRLALGAGLACHVGCGEAFSGLDADLEPEERVAGKWGHLLEAIPPGGNYLHYTAEQGCAEPLFGWRSRYWSFLLKLHPHRPAPTIQAQPGPYVGPFHWENRRLRVPEMRRLFTFPDDYEFFGSRRSAQSQVGNSVPPAAAAAVAAAVAAAADA